MTNRSYIISLVLIVILNVFSFIYIISNNSNNRSIFDKNFAVHDRKLISLNEQIDKLEKDIRRLKGRTDKGVQSQSSPIADPQPNESSFSGYTELMLLSNRRSKTQELKPVSTTRLLGVFGNPTENMNSAECSQPSSRKLLADLDSRDVGPFTARLIRPALDSLSEIFLRLRNEEPELYTHLEYYGGICARLVRGSEDMISRHAFGVAIDVSIGSTLDQMGDGKTQLGLIILADYFQEAGWVWGASFGREDSMHFEVSEGLFNSWYP